MILGLICAIVRYYKVPVFRHIITAYIELSRNTPVLIDFFFLYFGLTRLGIKIDSFACAVIGLTFLGGSYMAESFRSGLDAVHKGQIEAGASLGFTRFQITRYIVLPQAIAVAMPSIGANVLFLLKETSLVSVLALADLMFIAKDLIGLYYKTNEALFMLVISYLILLLPLSFLFRFLEKRMRFVSYGR
ncbi:polar amino acid ABC transporter permease [Spirochaetia bacterium]|nr:polar amino acid ABC transporter permease [Spirochaetia bacterium]